MRDRLLLANRVHNCNKVIRADIRRWKESGEAPTRSITIITPSGDKSLTLSMSDLTEIYGFDTLSAFIFMDSLFKANAKTDKCELRALLSQLKGSRCVHRMEVTPELLEQVRVNQPGVWAQYQKLVTAENARLAQLAELDVLNEEL